MIRTLPNLTILDGESISSEFILVKFLIAICCSGGLVGLIEVSDEIERHLENIQVDSEYITY